MFNRKKDEALETEIAALLFAMRSDDRASESYTTKVDQLTKLYALKETDSKSRVSADALVAAAGSLAGVLVIVIAENHSVISQKALGFVLKAR